MRRVTRVRSLETEVERDHAGPGFNDIECELRSLPGLQQNAIGLASQVVAWHEAAAAQQATVGIGQT